MAKFKGRKHLLHSRSIPVVISPNVTRHSQEGVDALGRVLPHVPHLDVGGGDREGEAGVLAVAHRHHVVWVAPQALDLLARVQVPDLHRAVCQRKLSSGTAPESPLSQAPILSIVQAKLAIVHYRETISRLLSYYQSTIAKRLIDYGQNIDQLS